MLQLFSFFIGENLLSSKVKEYKFIILTYTF